MNLIQSFDIETLLFINNNIKNKFFDFIMPLITSLGNSGAIWIIIGVLMILNKKNKKTGWKIIFALSLSLLIGNLFLKPIVGRIRPFDTYPYIDIIINKPLDSSFPSGHTMASFAASTVLFLTNKKIGIYFLILSFIIGFSRLYLFVHYPTDVIIGALIGTLIGIFSIKIDTFKKTSI